MPRRDSARQPHLSAASTGRNRNSHSGRTARAKRRRKWRWFRRAFWAFLCFVVLVLAGLHYVTREAFVRGPILHRLLGPHYDRNLEIGQIRIGIFPPSIRLFNIQLKDTRPNPGEPAVVADLGRLVLNFRLLPPNTVVLDRIEARGLEMHVVRDRKGVVNLLRAWEDMQEGRIPPPIRYETLAGNETSNRKVFLDRWDAGNWRISLEDQYRREKPLKTELDVAEIRVLRGTPEKPLNLANGLPLGMNAYFQLPSHDPTHPVSIHPVQAVVTVTDPLYPSRLGVSLRFGLKPSLKKLREQGIWGRATPRESGAVPDWPKALQAAPVAMVAAGTFAGGAEPTNQISNIVFSLHDVKTGRPLFSISEGEYNFLTTRMKGRFHAEGSPREMIESLNRLPLPPIDSIQSIKKALLAHDEEFLTSPALLKLDAAWTYDPVRMQPERLPIRGRLEAFSFQSLPGNLSLDVSLAANDIPYTTSTASSRKQPPPRLDCVAHATLGMTWPSLDVTVRGAEWQLYSAPRESKGNAGSRPAPNATASSPTPDNRPLLLNGRLAGPPFVIPLPQYLTVGKTTSPESGTAQTTGKRELLRQDAYDRVVRQTRNWYDWAIKRMHLLNRPPIRIILGCPPTPLSRLPWLKAVEAGPRPISGSWSGRATIQLFPEKGIDADIHADGQVSGLRKGQETHTLSVAGHLDLAIGQGAFEFRKAKVTITGPSNNPYEFEIDHSKIDLDAGKGELHFESRNLDHGFVDELMRFGGARAQQWVESHRNALDLVEYSRSDLSSSVTMNLKVDAFLAQRTLLNTQLKMNGLSLRRLRSETGGANRFNLAAKMNLTVDRPAHLIELGGLSSRMTEQGAVSPRVTFNRTGDEPVVFPSSDAVGLLGTVAGMIDEGILSIDRPATSSLVLAPSILTRIERVRNAMRSSIPLDFQIKWTGFRWTRIQGILEQFGLPFLEGSADVEGRFRLLPLPHPEPDHDKETSTTLATWSLSAGFHGLKLEKAGEGIEATLEAKGRVTRQELFLDKFLSQLARSSLRMEGAYNLVSGHATLNAGVANLGPVGLRTLERMRGHRLAEILNLERQLPTGLLTLAGGGESPRFELQWRAEQDRWGRKLKLQFEKLTRNLGAPSSFLGGTALRTDQGLEFDGINHVALNNFSAELTDENGISTPLLVVDLTDPVRLARTTPSADWRDARSGETPVVHLDVQTDLTAVSSHGKGNLDTAVGTGIRRGVVKVRLDSPLVPLKKMQVRSTFRGTARGVEPDGIDNRFDFSVRGHLEASLQQVALSDLVLAPLAGRGGSEVIHLNAARDFTTGDHSVDCRVRSAGPALLGWLTGPWRTLLSARGTTANLAFHLATRQQGRYEDRASSLTARNAALSRRGLEGVDRNTSPINPPLLISFNRSVTDDTATSLVLIHTFHLHVVPMDTSTTYSVVGLDLSSPAVFDPGTLTLSAPPGEPGNPEVHIHAGPIPLPSYAKAVAYWIGAAPTRGSVMLDATLSPHRGEPNSRETVVTGTARVENLDFRHGRPPKKSQLHSSQAQASGPPSEARVPSASPAGNSSGLPINGTLRFTLRSRAGVVSIDRLEVESANPPGMPADRLGIDGVLYTRRKGLSPDARIRADFVNLTKFWTLIREGLGERETRAEALPQTPDEVSPLATTTSDPGTVPNSLPSPDGLALRSARLRFEVKQLLFRRAKINNLTALLRFAGGRLQIPELSTDMGQGRLNISGVVGFRGGPGLSYRSNWSLTEVPLPSLFELFAPSLVGKGQALVSGTGELNGQGITLPNLNRYLTGHYSLRLEDGRITGLPEHWLLGDMSGLSAEAEARISRGNVDFQVTPRQKEARKTVRIRGYIKDVFGLRRLVALGRLELRTIVGPPPPRETGRIQPLPQNLVGVLCRISGPVDSPKALNVRVESYEY